MKHDIDTMRFATAVLVTSLPVALTGQCQLLPAGEFVARDGRPGNNLKWKVDDAEGQRLADQLNTVAAATPLVIDYEHQTMLSETNGQPAPAAGWMNDFEWKPGEGLFASVDWTSDAQAHIEGDRYRYISPVIDFNPKTGAITNLHNAALTNFPGLTGMKKVVAKLKALQTISDDDDQEPQVDLTTLCTQLGLPANTTAEQLAAHLAGLRSSADQAAALRAQLGLPADYALADIGTAVVGLRTQLGLTEQATLADVGTQVAQLRATAGTPDKATLSLVTTLQGQVAALTAAAQTREVAELVDGAIAAHKLLPAQRDWAVGFGKRDVAALRGFLEGAPTVQGLAGQSGGKDPGAAGTAEATAAESAVLKSMGITPAQFATSGKAAA